MLNRNAVLLTDKSFSECYSAPGDNIERDKTLRVNFVRTIDFKYSFLEALALRSKERMAATLTEIIKTFKSRLELRNLPEKQLAYLALEGGDGR